jgi:hypothetical protein
MAKDKGANPPRMPQALLNGVDNEFNADGRVTSKPPHRKADAQGRGVQIEDFVSLMPEHRYVYRPTGELWPAASVNGRLPPVCVGQDGNGKDKFVAASRILDQIAPVEQWTWAPGEPELIRGRLLKEGGWVERADVTVYNVYRPAIIVRRRGDVSPWINHVSLLYPAEAAHLILLLAFKVQRPGEKVNHGVLAGGAQGVGKDTIFEPIKLAVGPWNFLEVSPRQMLERFNGHQKAVFLRVSEARDLGDTERFAFYDHLKAVMAAPPDVLRINEKHLREYMIPNVVAVIITTNYKIGGIYLPADDRRHFVMWSPLTRADFKSDYFAKLYAWYAKGGAEIVADYLAALDISKFDPKAPPPQTEAFWQMVNSGSAPETAEMADLLEALGWPTITTLEELRAKALALERFDFMRWLADRKNSRAIPHRLEDCGYEALRNPERQDGLWAIFGRRQVIYGKRDIPWLERLKAARGLE